MKNISIKYFFLLPNGEKERFDLNLDPKTIRLVNNPSVDLPAWSRLEFHQCSICPLNSEAHSHCPLSVNLVEIVSKFNDLFSYDILHVKVVTRERIILQKTSAQVGISALMGLMIATSACPLTDFFKPMARFHLPLASEEETIWRAVSTYLMAQYFLSDKGKSIDIKLEGLTKIYDDIQQVNCSLAKRLRAASQRDSTINAIILLDLLAKTLPPVIDESLEGIRQMFVPFLKQIA